MINRAKLRGKPLDYDCRKAHTTTHEYGQEDERVFCYGLIDMKTDEHIEKCKSCKAFVENAEPIMKKYEIINPSDECYIYSNNLRVAKFCCLLLGNGRYGLTDCETNETAFGIYLFGISDEAIIEEFGEPLQEFLEHNKAEIVKCFYSFEYPYERTSLNNIGARANALAKKLGGEL